MNAPRPNAEESRLAEAANGIPWRRWGPYLSERQWGTVREDYSADGSAWDYFTHDQARSRAYRWGEDGLAGISDYLDVCVEYAKASPDDVSIRVTASNQHGAALEPAQCDALGQGRVRSVPDRGRAQRHQSGS
jgi:hypothetical protein